MAPGSDKTMTLSPPGTIGLFDEDAIVLLRFNEALAAIHPKDDAGSLRDLKNFADAGSFFGVLVTPPVEDGFTGKARRFSPPGTLNGLGAKDIAPGASLLTRDVTIQAIASWNAAGQVGLHADIGGIASRGLSGAAVTVSEYVCYGLEIATTSTSTFTGTLRMIWQDTGGSLRTDAGVSITCPPNTFTLLTATRRWVSPTQVVCRYYIGDLLLGENTNAFGSIGGGTTGTFQVGTRWDDGNNPTFFSGVIDQLMIVPRELTREEVESTWLRLTLYQPLGHRLFIDMHDDGFPLSLDPSSDQALETRMIGHALGFAAAQIENFRANALPGRAYGSVLDDWETVTRPTPSPDRDIDTRRARVVARLRQRRGSSIDGLGDALEGLLGGSPISNLQFLAFSTTSRDDFATLDPVRWDFESANWSSVSNALHVNGVSAVDRQMTGVIRNWKTCRRSYGGGTKVHFISKLAMTAVANSEAGIYVENIIGQGTPRQDGHSLLLGLRNNAGSYQVVYESFVNKVSQGVVVLATLGATPANLWLHLYHLGGVGVFPIGQSIWRAAYSITSGTAGFIESVDIVHPEIGHWAGMYMRTIGGSVTPATVADFDQAILRDPLSTRALNAYVLLDSTLGFSPDAAAGRSVISAIKHAFIHGAFIVKPRLLAGDPLTTAGVDPTGGY